MRRAPATWPAAVAACVLLCDLLLRPAAAGSSRGQLSDVPVYQHYGGALCAPVPSRTATSRSSTRLPRCPCCSSPSYMSWSYPTSFAVLMGLCGAGARPSSPRRCGRPAPGRHGSRARCSCSGSRRSCSARSSTRASTSGRRCSRSEPSRRSCGSGHSFTGALARARLRSEALAGRPAADRSSCNLWRRRGEPSGWAVISRVRRRGGRLLRALRAHCLRRGLRRERHGAARPPAAGGEPRRGDPHGPRSTSGMRPLTTIATNGGAGAGAAAARASPPTSRRRLELRDGPRRLDRLCPPARRRRRDRTPRLRRGRRRDRRLRQGALAPVPDLAVPFVLLLRGLGGAAATVLLLLALGLTQLWFPVPYWLLADNHASPYSWYLLARDLAARRPRRRPPLRAQPRTRFRRRKRRLAGRSASRRMR